VLSICVALKNRSRVIVEGRELRLFPNCVDSIRRSVGDSIPAELVIADWNSDDWPLDQWLSVAASPLPARVISLEGNFSRGRGRNAAANAALGDALLFLDADSLVCGTVIERGLDFLQEGKAYFPVLFSFHGPEHESGWWRHEGYGNCMLTREAYESAGGWPEYQSWGKEDDHFYSRVASINAAAREEVIGFYHQWHPNDVGWKDRLVEKSPHDVLALQQIRAACVDLEKLIPAGSTYILVDEDWFGVNVPQERQALPFLEHDGIYWGLPEDDTAAIREFERLRGKGITFIVFAWMSFWWLDYYSRFHNHIHSSCRQVFQDDRLVVFRLGE
jgi:glycosyltransferase involved in cell wall biosynthesis